MAKALRIVMLGPPGAGKGTQAVLIAQGHGISHISTGVIFREAIERKSELGLKVKQIVDSGALVPDDIVIALVKERLAQPDCARGFLFDGFPRTVAQAQALDELLVKLSKPLTHIVDLAVPEAVLLERIKQRAGGRADDSAEVAANRLKVYWEQTSPVTRYYRESKAPLKVVDGLGTVEEVQQRIERVLNG
jgi:adenylate kinase